MEVTQYKYHVIPKLYKKYKAYVQELESSLLDFPDIIPKSSIIFPATLTSERRMFMQLYEKYIDNGAEWKVDKLSDTVLNEILQLYRRCKLNRAKQMTEKHINPADDDTLVFDEIMDKTTIDQLITTIQF